MTDATGSDTGIGPAPDFFEGIPYESFPFHESHPSHLAAMATLFGLRPPPVSRARVLELGCASGGNIIPMAARSPDARFQGYDLSPKHVELARARISELGLENISVDVADISEPDFVQGPFDYIICHGVFSWVDRKTQDAILRICSENLAETGVAYISFNVLPGWQMRKIIRDIFWLDDDDRNSVSERIANGRWLLNQLAQGTDQSTPYGQLLQKEAAQLAAQSDSYIAGEFLVPENDAFYFRDFAARAGSFQLAHLADASLSTTVLEVSNPQLDQVLRAMAGPSKVKYEQFLDLRLGRQFRKALLVKSGQAPGATQRPNSRYAAALHFSSRLRLVPQDAGQSEHVLRDPDGRQIATNDPLAAKALDHLGQVFPETRSLPAVLETLGAGANGDRNEVAARLLDAMFRIAVSGLGWIGAQSVQSGHATDPAPALCPLARAELRAGQKWLTNLRHSPVNLDPIGMVLAPLLDGKTSPDQLVDVLESKIADGTLSLSSPEDAGTNISLSPEHLQELIRRWLLKMEHLGLLMPTK